jgi:hypothetical protein
VLRKHGRAALALKSVASNKIFSLLGQISKSRQIKPSWSSIGERMRLAHQIFHDPRNAWTHHVFAKIMPDVRIADFREHHQPRRFQRGCP